MNSDSTLSNYCEIIMGQSPAGDTCNKIGMGIPLLNGPSEFGDSHPTPVQFTSDAKRKSNIGDLLFCVRGSTGRMNWSNQEYAIGRGLAAIRAINNYPIVFVKAIIETKLHELLLKATGSVFSNVNKEMIAGISIRNISVNEAKSIGSTLKSIEDQISLLRKSNSTLEAIAQTLFKSWFLDFDPVYAKQKGKKPEGMDESTAALFPNSFENSVLGEIPKGWEIKNLGQVAYNVKSRIKNAEDWKNLDLLDLSRMPRKILFPFEYGKGKELSTSVFEFKKDDCLFGAVRPYFHKVCHATRNGVTNSSVLVIRSLVPENQFFVNLVASSKECVTHATSYSQGTKMPTINWENLSRFSIICPPNNLQSIFSKYVSLFFKKALNNSLIINLLTELRDVLLPRLISGHLRLSDIKEINNKTEVNA
jgi:type I restriction enzyme S subunit